MKLNRAELLAAVENVEPALSSQKLVEELQHVWFSDEGISAYNDSSLGIVAPYKSGLSGGVRGQLLLGFLKNSRAKELEVELKDEGVAEIKAGKTRLSLSLLPGERCPWHFPKPDKAPSFKASQSLLEGLKAVQVSIGPGTTKPEQLGVTVIREDGYLSLYTTDAKTISWAMAKQDGWPKKRVIIPTPFIKQLVKLEEPEVWLSSDSIVAITDKLSLFSSLVEDSSPFRFDEVPRENGVDDSDLFPIPKKLKMALERMAVMLKGYPNEAISIKVEGNMLSLFVKTPMGELRDSMKIEADLPKQKGKVMPDLVARVLDRTNSMAFANHSLVMVGEDFTCWVAKTSDD